MVGEGYQPLMGEVGGRGKIMSTAASSWLRASMGARITVTTESTGGGREGDGG